MSADEAQQAAGPLQCEGHHCGRRGGDCVSAVWTPQLQQHVLLPAASLDAVGLAELEPLFSPRQMGLVQLNDEILPSDNAIMQ